MIFLLESESIKHKFIGKYILPLYEPAVEYFSQYGIKSVTVHAVPTLIVLLIYVIILVVKRETKSFEFKVYFVILIVSVLLTIYAQLNWV
jgi:hypothetical protein